MFKKEKEEIIVHEGRKLKVVEVIEEGKSQEEVAFERWSNETYCLKAVEEDGYALQYVKEQTENICLKAVEEDGDALRYVKEQTENVCLKAVEEDGYALQYVKDQTENVCLKAVEKNGDALQYVKEQKTFLKILKRGESVNSSHN